MHLILFREKILLGENKRWGVGRRERKKERERERGRERHFGMWLIFHGFPPGGGIVSNSDKLVN